LYIFPPIDFILRYFVVYIKNAQLFSYVATSFFYKPRDIINNNNNINNIPCGDWN
jgi:hypothetical protein